MSKKLELSPVTSDIDTDLPSGWCEASLNELLRSPTFNGRSVTTATVGFPVLRLTAIKDGRIDLEERKIGDWTRDDALRFLVKDGDFFVARGSGSIRLVGRGGLVTNTPDEVAFPDTFIRIDLNRKIVNPRLFAQQWNSLRLRKQIERESKTTAGIYKISQGDVSQFSIRVPPPNEQTRLADEIDKYITRLDAAVAGLRRVQANLKRYRASVLKAAVEGRLVPTEAELARQEGREYEPASVLLERILAERRRRWEEAELAKMKAKGKTPKDDKWKAKYKAKTELDLRGLPTLPPGWAYARADEIVEPGTVISYGIVLPGKCVEDGIPYIRGKDIEDGKVLTEQLLRTDPEIAAKHRRSELARGDVLLCVIRHLKVAVVPEGLDGANLTQGTVRMRPSFAISGSFLATWLRSPHAQTWMKSRYFGMAMPRINVEDARDLPVPVAPLAEQERICEAIDEALSVEYYMWQQLQLQMTRCARLRQSILKWAFEGKLVDQDPNDEPASVLLKRIRAEREAATSSAKPKATRSAKPSRKPRRTKKPPTP